MKLVKLYTGNDDHSHFEEINTIDETVQPLGKYSEKYPVQSMMFRDFEAGLIFDWHNAPQPQYIVYLEGEVQIEISHGEKQIFKAGDILLVMDLTGKGHITRTLTRGRSIIIIK